MYFTDFERDYKNIENSAVNIRVEKATPEEIAVVTDIGLENAEYIDITILDNENNVVGIQNESASSDRHTITKRYMLADEKTTFNLGEKYRMYIGVLDKDRNLIYRWHEYVTIQ